MHRSTDLDTLAVFEEVARYDVSTCSDTPIVISRYGSAGNDAVCDDPTTSDTQSHQQYQAARTHRSFTLREIIIAAINAVIAFAHRAHARHQQRQHAGAVYDALRELDDRTLHDLGFDRSEMTSVAAEVTRGAEPTRVRATLMTHTLP